MSELSTYKNVSPEFIRAGDQVQDSTGRTFFADTDAEWNENSLTWDIRSADNLKWVSYDPMDGVTLTYAETESYAY